MQLYKDDLEESKDRMTRWWKGEDMGRPAMELMVPREEPIEHIPIMPPPEGWTGRYSTRNFEYRVNLARRACVSTHYLAEALPAVSADLAPNTLTLYLGCEGVEQHNTVWCEPCIEIAETARFEMPSGNPSQISEGGEELMQAKDFIIRRNEEHETVCGIPSGIYRFTIEQNV